MGDSFEGVNSMSDLEELGLDAEALSDFDLLAEGVFKILSDNLGFVLHSVGMYDPGSDGIRIINDTNHPRVNKILYKFSQKNLDNFVFPLAERDNLIVRSYLEQKMFVRDSVLELAYPVIASPAAKLINKFLNLSMVVVLPLVVKGKSVGVFGFGSRDKKELSLLEKDFLVNLSNRMAPYFKSAWFIRGVLEKNESLIKYKSDLEEFIKVKQDFLHDISDLLSSLTSEFGIKEDTRHDIQDALKYLKSLFLVSHSISKRYEEDEGN